MATPEGWKPQEETVVVATKTRGQRLNTRVREDSRPGSRTGCERLNREPSILARKSTGRRHSSGTAPSPLCPTRLLWLPLCLSLHIRLSPSPSSFPSHISHLDLSFLQFPFLKSRLPVPPPLFSIGRPLSLAALLREALAYMIIRSPRVAASLTG